MVEVYRLEDRFGNGPYFYRDGWIKSRDWKSNDKELYAFVNPARFTEPSYVSFLDSDDYVLYKIVLFNYVHQSIYGEITFLEEHISKVTICDKEICRL